VVLQRDVSGLSGTQFQVEISHDMRPYTALSSGVWHHAGGRSLPTFQVNVLHLSSGPKAILSLVRGSVTNNNGVWIG
jgi:hypothetical protein